MDLTGPDCAGPADQGGAAGVHRGRLGDVPDGSADRPDCARRSGGAPGAGSRGPVTAVIRLRDGAWVQVLCAVSDRRKEPDGPLSIRHLIARNGSQDARLAGKSAPPELLRLAGVSDQAAFCINKVRVSRNGAEAYLAVRALPCLVGDADPDLVRCLPPVAELDSEFWLIVREDVKSVPHVRAFADFFWEHVQGLRAQLAGG